MSHHHQGRSAASQFFIEGEYGGEEEDEYGGGGGMGRRASSSGIGSRPTSARMDSGFEANDYQDEQEVAELLTKATVTSSEKTKLENLKRVNEIIIKKQPALLDNFLNEMLDFQTDSNADIRRYILEFIENACKTDPETIPKVLHNMMLMLQDKNVTVQKQAIQICSKLYKYTLMWLCKSKNVTDEMESAWNLVNELKKFILKLIDSDLDGIRTHSVKFIETVILLQTSTEADSIKREGEFCLDDVPINIKIARPRKLEEDARSLFEELLKFHGSRHATSVNLMTCMGSIILISKLRPHFMGRVVTAMEKLNAILPPTLERSQVTSVRKYMKAQLIGLLKHPRAIDYYDNITTLLTDLGASSSDLYKAIPNWDEIKAEKRKRHRVLHEKEEYISRKRARLQVEEEKVLEEDEPILEDYDDDEDMEKVDAKTGSSLTDIEQNVFKQLTPEMAAEMVFASMEQLPEAMPAHFTASFTPIAMAGTESQIRHVSRLLAAQITAFQLGPEAALKAGFNANEYDDEPIQIPTLVSGASLDKENKVSLFTSSTAPTAKRNIIKMLKLSEIVKPLTMEENQKHVISAIKRIFNASDKLDDVRSQLVCSIAINSTFDVKLYIMQHIQNDIKNLLDLGISWLFAEYCLCQDFFGKSLPNKYENPADQYEWTFVNLMRGILDSTAETEKSMMARRLYMESPTIPDKGLELLKLLCAQPLHATNGMTLLMDLALKRPRKLYYLSTMLEFCAHSIDEVRTQAVTCVMNLYNTVDSMRAVVEDHAVRTYMHSLRLQNPPEILFTDTLGRVESIETQKTWNDELVKSCLGLYLQLLTVKNSLIHELAKIYVETTSEVKRSILRYVEQPVRKMGIDPPELMKLLDNFPKGAETLITRIIHLLTDKALPSAELVSRVRNLYAKRVSDVRFLIPVLNGLAKSEIISALPKLIKLNPNVVKEVFNRLLGIHTDSKTQHKSPITPVELMVALHNIEPTKCDVKTIIKATSMCFNESEVYTAEVLAVVINQLLEQVPLPTLLMRTVIQTLALHSKLSGFIMNTLSRLVNKQVWTQPKVWEGFVKCCQRTIPKSIPVLLTLPPPQLKQALEEAPDLRSPIGAHLMSLSDQQRSCLPPTLLNIVLGDYKAGILKKEYQDYNDLEGEVVAVGSVGSLPKPMKNEPGSPGGEEELSIEIKDEPMDYQQNTD